MSIKNSIKQKYPSLFWILKSIKNFGIKEVVYYYQTIQKNSIYLGKLFLADQVDPRKAPIMKSLIEKEVAGKQNFKVLEIGTWAGASAILWGNVVKGLGKVFCVELFDVYEPLPLRVKEKIKAINKQDRLAKLFLHNIRAAGLKETIIPLIGKSENILPQLKEGSFDFVYVDGGHSYSQCIQDLKNSIPLVKDGGVLCGDDLEMQMAEIDYKECFENRECDTVITDKKSGEIYHPGVTLAMDEIFGKVSAKNTFWAIRKSGGGWKSVNL